MDNPYAPPIPVAGAADLSPREADFYEKSFWWAIWHGILVSAAAGSCVLLYQFLRYSFDWDLWPRGAKWTIVPEAASFSSAGFFAALAFAVPSRGDFRAQLLSVVFGVVGLLLCMAGLMLFRTYAGVVVLILLFPASQMVTLATICWIRRVPIRWPRLLIAGGAGFGAWFALGSLAIFTFVSRQTNPYDDYAGYTSLTVFWCWTVAAQVPFLLSDPRRHAADKT